MGNCCQGSSSNISGSEKSQGKKYAGKAAEHKAGGATYDVFFENPIKPKNPEDCKDKNGKFNLTRMFSNLSPELIHVIPTGTFSEINGLGISEDNRHLLVLTKNGQLEHWDCFN
jgi:hypothetical protein